MKQPLSALVVSTLRLAAALQPRDWESKAESCDTKTDAYLLAWQNFQHDLIMQAHEIEEAATE